MSSAKSSVLRGEAPGTKLDVKGSEAGFVVVAPQGVRGGTGGDASKPDEGDAANALAAAADAAAEGLLPKQRWSNATVEGDRLHAVEQAEKDVPDDIAFLYAVATCVRDTLSVPLSGAMLASGWSEGAKLASNLACLDPDAPKPGRDGFTLAAVAVGAGITRVNCSASAAVPLLMLQGGSDAVVPFCHAGVPYKAGADSLSSLAAARGCPPLNRSGDSGWTARCGAAGDGENDLRLYTPSRCDKPDAAPIALYWLPKLPHDVPSGNLPGLNGSFADLVAQFFKSVVRGAPEVAPLRSAKPGEPPMDKCSGTGPCASGTGVKGAVRDVFNG
jgi:poly(3-hydroxybutyrate) depolymerase